MYKTLPLSLLLAVALLAGCAGMTSNKSPETAVAERAQQRWDALIASDWEAAHALLTPGYRSANPYEGFRLAMVNRRVNWKQAQVDAVECASAERCTVSMRITYELAEGMRGVGTLSSETVSREDWLRLDGQWFHLPRD